jgi:tRNA threonylcarbamoyladenosine biosynthesis protein TsaB
VLILGIDTATPAVGCAIGGHEGVLASFSAARGRRHAETLVPAIDHLRRAVGIELDELGAVAVDVGPGLFTGLRVGVATAKAMASALRVPVVGVPSLDLVAFPVRFTPRLVASVVDARRGEVFFAFYRSVPGGVMRIGDFRVERPDALAAELEALGDEVLLVGNGAILYRRELVEPGVRAAFASAAQATPAASALVDLAAPRFIREDTDRPADVVPLYLRKTDAEIAWDQRARGASA